MKTSLIHRMDSMLQIGMGGHLIKVFHDKRKTLTAEEAVDVVAYIVDEIDVWSRNASPVLVDEVFSTLYVSGHFKAFLALHQLLSEKRLLTASRTVLEDAFAAIKKTNESSDLIAQFSRLCIDT